jgi:hypothetical protein
LSECIYDLSKLQKQGEIRTWGKRMKVFLSYAKSDAQEARNLDADLSKAGFEVWYPDKASFPGENWWLKIGEELKGSGAMVVLLSPDSVNSSSVQHEIEYALSSPRFENRLIPVMIRPTKSKDFPWILRKLAWIDAGSGDRSQTVNRIVQHLQGIKSEKTS